MAYNILIILFVMLSMMGGLFISIGNIPDGVGCIFVALVSVSPIILSRILGRLDRWVVSRKSR